MNRRASDRTEARRHTAAAVETLVAVMQDADTPPTVRVAAAQALLDRGWGRPAAQDPVAGPARPGRLVIDWPPELGRAIDRAGDAGAGGPPEG